MSKAALPMKRRQAILDHLNQHGESSSPQIGAAVGLSRGAVNTYLREMRNDGEVSVRDKFIGRVMHVTYTALMTETTTGVKVPVRKVNATTTTSNGRMVHLGTERDHPMPSGGGQGALRREWGIQSSAGLL